MKKHLHKFVDNIEYKQCPTCNGWYLLSEFHKHYVRWDGLVSKCKSCARAISRKWSKDNQAKRTAYSRIWRKNNKQKLKEYILKNAEKRHFQDLFRKYGLTITEYKNLLKKQGMVCAICRKPERRVTSKRLVVDHNHKTKKVRGLLCDACNRGIGYLREDIIILINAVNYLKGV